MNEERNGVARIQAKKAAIATSSAAVCGAGEKGGCGGGANIPTASTAAEKTLVKITNTHAGETIVSGLFVFLTPHSRLRFLSFNREQESKCHNNTISNYYNRIE